MNIPVDASQRPITLRVTDLGKEYRLYDTPKLRLKSILTGRNYHNSHWALRGVSFQLKRGQCLGVVGNNGAGKSSLLKLLAGTMQPSHGSVVASGRITAILELGAGFHPEFTGRDNLYFAGNLIGLDTPTVRELEASIIDFSELGPAIDRPVKTYSSGMTVRLAFALITAVTPDVLIIDEALAVGDQHFQKKCVERIEAFRQQGCTILFCSHSLYHVKQLCDQALWLDKGQVRAYGETQEVLASYESFVRAQDLGDLPSPELDPSSQPAISQVQVASGDNTRDNAAQPNIGLPASGQAGLISVRIADLDEDNPALLQSRDLLITIVAQAPAGECPSIGVMLEQAHGVGITSATTHNDGHTPASLGNDRWEATIRFSDLALHTGEYVLSVYLFDSRGLVVYEEWMRCAFFKFIHPQNMPGLLRLPHTWS